MITKKKITNERKKEIGEMLKSVYSAMDAKGYDAISQIWGYLLSEDPTYVTTYNNARKLITGFDREEIGRVLLESFLEG